VAPTFTAHRRDRASPPERCGRALVAVGLVACALAGCGPETQPVAPVPSGDGWREFEGTWTAAGNRHTLRLGPERRASTADFTGSLLLTGPGRPGVGFRAEAIVLNDSVTGMVGRAVWTDERGDQAFSELRGEGTATGSRVTGTLVGGTGRYAGVTGTYEFSWRFVLEAEDGQVQGQSVGLKGRVQFGTPPARGPQPGAH
jgi:hypothetical protein